MSHVEPAEHVAEEHGLSVRRYLEIGALLTVVTIAELAVSYAPLGDAMIPILLILSTFKFIVVVMFFMHLRFDSPVFTRMFVGSMLLAMGIMAALLALFWGDSHTIPPIG